MVFKGGVVVEVCFYVEWGGGGVGDGEFGELWVELVGWV